MADRLDGTYFESCNCELARPCSTITLAQATRARFSAFGYELDLAGKNGHAAPFSWDV